MIKKKITHLNGKPASCTILKLQQIPKKARNEESKSIRQKELYNKIIKQRYRKAVDLFFHICKLCDCVAGNKKSTDKLPERLRNFSNIGSQKLKIKKPTVFPCMYNWL